MCKDIGIAWRWRFAFVLLTTVNVKFGDAVEFISAVFCGCVTLALLCGDVNDEGALSLAISDVLKDGYQIDHPVAIDWTDVIQAHFLKHGTTTGRCPGKFFPAFAGRMDDFRKALGDGFHDASDTEVRFASG